MSFKRIAAHLAVTWIVLITPVCVYAGSPAQSWYPLPVTVWKPPFNTRRERVIKTYTALEKADKNWHFCVLIPHLKDAYWLAVNYGLVDQARALGVDLTIFEAGGYERLDVQRRQFDECMDQAIDGIILSAISSDGLNDKVAAARQRDIPVLDLINQIASSDITARAAVDYYDAAFEAGRYLRKIAAKREGPLTVAWFPGPEGAGWVAAGDAGFRAALEGSNLEILTTKKGDTGKSTQAKLIKAALDEFPDQAFDYLVGTTVSAEAAVSVLRSRGLEKRTGVIAYYYGPGVNRGIKRGTILAAPTDSPVIQARLAVDILTRILQEQPYFAHVAPRVELIDQARQRDWDSSTALAPRGFRPIFRVGD